ncbi:unnamed protein product [Oikopleura dioica]|uniref:Uncharacterized protein n=1 Tax=Oikopleura dioica TaxID=34765 RepID=E4XHJ6_OIKDI|nr:unnamed protein product [Oikopleura dioica]
MPQLNKERETLNNHSDLATEILDKLSAQPVELEHAALANSPEESIELICSGEIEVSFEEALKIFILLCWRNNGLSQKFLDAYRVDLLNIYGHDRLLCFMKAAQEMVPKINQLSSAVGMNELLILTT